MAIDQHDLYKLELLKHVEKDRKVTNRLVAQKLGVSVRLAHDILKRMVEKGLLHVKVIHSRRWDYFLTPKGIMEKARLTIEFFEFSTYFYREARKRSAQVCKDLTMKGVSDIGILGSGDLAEITYLGIQEWNLNLEYVFDSCPQTRTFLNLPIRPFDDIEGTNLAAIIVCIYDAKNPMKSRYLPPNIDINNKFFWIF